ncbi:MAG TPA: hypothetical protein VFW44_11280 [Bryobacteraceae bacterium]|nr:hypothetical protein [Bryobacteraceae bacterium]
MRSNRNPSGPVTRSVGVRSAGERPLRPALPPVIPAAIPMEWLDAGSWRLPSGKALAEFALQAGFLAPLLFRTDGALRSRMPRVAAGSKSEAGAAGTKHYGKGESR